MAICVHVCLLSGRRLPVDADLDCTVQQLRLRAQALLGAPLACLVDRKRGLLAPDRTLREAGLEAPHMVFALLRHAALSANYRSFALLRADGSVATWGSRHCCLPADSPVQAELRDVLEICGSDSAFAAIRCDGSVVTWGNEIRGGDSTEVQHQLKNVRSIWATSGAFAALREDGGVVTWGDAECGGDSSSVQAQLHDVRQIRPARQDFAALLGDGSVVTWGDGSADARGTATCRISDRASVGPESGDNRTTVVIRSFRDSLYIGNIAR